MKYVTVVRITAARPGPDRLPRTPRVSPYSPVPGPPPPKVHRPRRAHPRRRLSGSLAPAGPVRGGKWRPGRIVPSRTPSHRSQNRAITRKSLDPSEVPTRTILPERHNRDDPVVLRTRPSPAGRPLAPRRDPGRFPPPLRTAYSTACACSPGPRSPRKPPGSPRPAATCAAAGRAARSGAD